ncbi:MAG TPA: hypothetical protein VMV49_09945 [Candidatus Deferrimicrobium sp.]|nr:hypothetical protein [Candidatus Deferrimicrobium sp.]
MDEKKQDFRQRRQFNQKRRDNRDQNQNRGPPKPMNIRYGTRFCGDCRACKFWIDAKFGRYRCENSYLPFEILEFRRDGQSNHISEIVLNLLI